VVRESGTAVLPGGTELARNPDVDGIAAELVTALIRRGDSPETRRAYAGNLRTFAGWLRSEGLRWDAVGPDDLDRYRESLAARYARTTVNRRLSVVRSLYGEAERRDRIGRDPAVRLRGLRGVMSASVVS
jgi:site-specific recombinase XerD